MCFLCVWTSVAFGDDGDDEYERVSEHRQRDRHQLQAVQHDAAADGAAAAGRRQSGDDHRAAEHD